MIRKITVTPNLNAQVEIVSLRGIIHSSEECFSKATVHKCSVKKAFLEISQNSEKNNFI